MECVLIISDLSFLCLVYGMWWIKDDVDSLFVYVVVKIDVCLE